MTAAEATRAPERVDVLIIGGGPGGATAAAALAREGVDVCVLERARFPRYHIGESLLPAVQIALDFTGALEKVASQGFVVKRAGLFRVKRDLAPGHIDFTKRGDPGFAWQVERSAFDEVLLRHAEHEGATIVEGCSVREVRFDGDRAVAATWRSDDGAEGTVHFDHLIDASGLAGVLARTHLKNRRFQEQFANIAVCGYWRGARGIQEFDDRAKYGDFYMEVLPEGVGWVWLIPLRNDRVSVGVVLHRDELARQREATGSVEAMYHRALKDSGVISSALAPATLAGEIRSWSDYSYVADRFAGENWYLIGDAAGFIDPLFSSGVHLALVGALSASACICEVRSNPASELPRSYHDRLVRNAYTNFVILVAGFYRQLRRQDEVVLHGVDEESLQHVFDGITPVASGNMELTTPNQDQHQARMQQAMQTLSDLMLEIHGLDSGSDVAKLLMSGEPTRSSGTDAGGYAVHGHTMRLVRGRLGLEEVSDKADAMEPQRPR